MVSKAAKVRLGIFVVVGITLLLLFFVVVAGNSLIQRHDIYYIRFQNYSVTGLQVGGLVNYRGIQVGKVDKIFMDPKDVESVVVTVSLDHGTPIKADNEVVLTYIGITGIKAIEIRGGTNKSKLLKPKSFIKTGSTQLDALSGKAVSIIDKVNEIATNLNKLTGADNQQNITSILQETSMLVTDLRSHLSSTLESVDKIANNTAGITDGLGSNFSRLTDSLTKNLDSLTTSTTSNISRIGNHGTASLDSLTLVTKTSLERLTNELSQKLDLISTNMNDSITELNANASSLLVDTRTQLNNIGSHSDTLILDTSRQVAEMTLKINSALNHVDQLFASPEFDDLVGNISKLAGQLNDANVKGLVGELSVTINKAGLLMTTIDRTLSRNRSNLNETLENLREISNNLNEFTRQISDQPSILIRGN